MKPNSYTLDRFEGDYAIFLKHPHEVEQLLIARTELDKNLEEGAIVTIEDDGTRYIVKELEEATAEAKESVASLLAKLQKKNK